MAHGPRLRREVEGGEVKGEMWGPERDTKGRIQARPSSRTECTTPVPARMAVLPTQHAEGPYTTFCHLNLQNEGEIWTNHPGRLDLWPIPAQPTGCDP
jgi:hypothetical protein